MSLDSSSPSSVDPSNFRLGIVSSQFNQSLVISLLHRVTEVIEENGTPLEFINETVPGANEIPSAMALILEKKALSCMIALGVVIKGSTSHHHLVAECAGHALQDLSIRYKTPIINGIIVADDLSTAKDRIVGSIDRGGEFAHAALQMAHLKEKWTKIS